LKGDKEMDYRIEEKEAFAVVGKSIDVTCADGENLRQIPKFWADCHANGTCAKLESIGTDDKQLGICLNTAPGKEEFTYMIASKAGADAAPDGFTTAAIPAHTWAIFPSVGPMPGAIQSVFQRIFSEWFPATGYEHAAGPELEVYPIGDAYREDYRCEVWIPIVKK
jgi:AraC family transcriptional regulator